jgi:hypothetical protein
MRFDFMGHAQLQGQRVDGFGKRLQPPLREGDFLNKFVVFGGRRGLRGQPSHLSAPQGRANFVVEL